MAILAKSSGVGSGGKFEIVNGREETYVAYPGTQIAEKTFIEKVYQYARETNLASFSTGGSMGQIIWEGDNECLFTVWTGGNNTIYLARMVNDKITVVGGTVSFGYANQAIDVIAKLDTNRWLIHAYSNSPILTVLTYSGGKLSTGTALSISENEKPHYVSSSMVILTYAFVGSGISAGSNYIQVKPVSISGTTLTAGTAIHAKDITTSYSETCQSIVIDAVVALSTSSVCMIYTYATKPSYGYGSNSEYREAVAMSISGKTITAGTALSVSGTGDIDLIIKLSSGYFCAKSPDYSDPRLYTFGVSGTTVSYGSTGLSSSMRVWYNYIVVDSTRIVSITEDNSMIYTLWTRSGTTTTAKASKTHSGGSTNQVTKINATKYVITSYYNNYIYAITLTISSSSLTSTETKLFYNVAPDYKGTFDGNLLVYKISSGIGLIDLSSGDIVSYTVSVTLPSDVELYNKVGNLLYCYGKQAAVVINVNTRVVIFNANYVASAISGFYYDHLFRLSNGSSLMHLTETYVSSSSRTIDVKQYDILATDNSVLVPGYVIQPSASRIDGVTKDKITDSISGVVYVL